MEIPTISLKSIVLVHWLLTIWACLISWLPTSYVLGNMGALAVGVWAIAQRDSIDAALMFLIGLAVTILTDIVHFALYYAAAEIQYKGVAPALFRFSGGLAITSLMLKPVSCLYIYQIYRVRGGEYNVNFDLETSVDSHYTTDSADRTLLSRRYRTFPPFPPAVLFSFL